MQQAFILINTKIGEEKQAFKTLKNIPNIKQAHQIYGVYDIIAKLEAETIDAINNTISLNIRKNKHIESTITLLVP